MLPAFLPLFLWALAAETLAVPSGSTFVPPASSSLFKFDLSCGTSTAAYCASVNSTLQTAGAYIADAIHLSSPIRVNASVVNLCELVGDCDTNNVIAAGSPANPAIMKDTDGRYRIYPLPIARTLVATQETTILPSSQYDIIIYINIHPQAWFPGDGPIYHQQIDLSWTILHELMHGLGMGTSWKYHLDTSVNGPKTATILYPYPSAQGADATGTFVYSGQVYTNIYDRFISETSSQATLDTRLPAIDAAASPGAAIPSAAAFVSDIIGNTAANAAASGVRQLINTQGTISFVPTDGTRILLDTDPTLPSSALDHVGPSFAKTPDTLMLSIQSQGVAYANVIRDAGGKFPIGPRTLAILETIGYTLTPQTIELPQPFPSSASISGVDPLYLALPVISSLLLSSSIF